MSNGSGGVDWGQLELACAFYGVQDIEAIVEGLLQIKHHRPPGEGRTENEATEDD